jgi:transcriptional regulator with XRE-family HTH domain
MPKTIHSAEYQAFLDLLVQARIKAGISQVDLAKVIKKPQSYISKYENGERRLDVIEFIIIAKTLKADPRKIFNRMLQVMK